MLLETTAVVPQKRCAIYTRKSIDLGLDRDFNTLEGQRAICSAYISSQRHRGWTELASQFDDGGVSGATLDRPALQLLCSHIEQGLVDVVLVYKLDRLTRTLVDFVRLMDFFERYGVVFVSITQNFDTDDSLGRLILNVLLTFAQFEREMAADRIRDKILVTKQSGRWAGGPAPYGYDLKRRRLHVNDEESAWVKRIFKRYLEVQNLTGLFNECREAGMRSKCWKTRAGRIVGGGPLTKSLVNHILHNPIYVGDIRHRDKSYPGLHLPVVDRATFDAVQKVRAIQANKKAHRNRENILTDVLFDCFGRPMCMNRNFVEGRFRKPSRFYISQQSKWGKREDLKRLRARGDDLESLVCTTLQEFLGNRQRIRSVLLERGIHDRQLNSLARAGSQASKRLENISRDRLGGVIRALIVRIELSLERVKLVLRCCEIERFLRWDGVGLFKPCRADWERSSTVLVDVPAGAIRYRRTLMMPIEPRSPGTGLHQRANLRTLLKEARELQRLVDAERDKTLNELADEAGLPAWRFARVLRLNYLAPDIITSILDGTQPADLTRTKLINAVLPMDWALQRKLLGFPGRPTLEGCE